MTAPDVDLTRGRLRDEHDAAVAEFVARARRLAPAVWSAELAPGKWSPAQIADHLARTYDAVLRELEGGEAMRFRVPAWKRTALRLFALPYILRTRRLPRATAPREIRPGAEPMEREALLERLESAARRAGAGLASAPSAIRMTHPYFGAIDPERSLRLSAIHTRHHVAQLPD